MIFLQWHSPAWRRQLPGVALHIRQAANMTLQAVGAKRGAQATIVLADDALVTQLNHQYRNKNRPTNVLSFADADESGNYLGDIILGFETIAREAHEQNKPLMHHVQHLTIHGLLHLIGHDHEIEAEAEEMENLEISVLAALNISNPYLS